MDFCENLLKRHRENCNTEHLTDNYVLISCGRKEYIQSGTQPIISYKQTNKQKLFKKVEIRTCT